MYTSKHTNHAGFVALISIVMLSVVLLGATISLAQFGIANRFFILDLENKNVSEQLAEACIHVARIYVYNDPLFNPQSPVTLSIGEKTCTIHSVIPRSPENNESTVNVQATSGNSVTNMQAIFDVRDGRIISLMQLPKL